MAIDKNYEVISLEDCEDFIIKYGDEMINNNQEYPVQLMNEFINASPAIDGEYTVGIDKLHGQTLHFKKIVHGYELDFIVWNYEFVQNGYGGMQCNISGGKIHLYISGQEMVNLRYYWHNLTLTAMLAGFSEFIWSLLLYRAIKYDTELPLIGKHLAKINGVLAVVTIAIIIATTVWIVYSYRHYLRDRKILKNEKLTKMNY